MPVTDLSNVTMSLQRLLEFNINQVIDPGLAPNATVNTLPPERVTGGANVLNLHLYGVAEDEHLKLRPREASGASPIATSPMSLVLHYIVTAHTLAGTVFDSESEQRLLGYALKTFHDNAVIDDETEIAGQRIFPAEIQGRNNRFEITMRQLGPEEALNYWNSHDSFTAKLSGYYEVRQVELEPEPPTRIPGIVLNLGVFILDMNTPNIGSTEGDLPYVLPSQLGGGQTTNQASPARVGPVAAAPPATNILRLLGAGLARGESQQLLISNRHWSILVPELERIPVDLALNSPLGWSQALTPRGVEATVGEDLQVMRPNGTVDTLALYPGVYLASWEITDRFETPDGQRVIRERSNDAPFFVYPRITGFTRNPATGEVTLDLGGSFLLNRGRPPPADPVAEPELDILLSVDGIGYDLVTAFAAGGLGDFTIAAHALTYRPLADANTSGLHTIRLIVEGADSQPFWLEIP